VIFVDTGAFLARYVARDQYHKRAVTTWRRIEKRRDRCFTSNFVLDETFTLLARRTSYAFAAERARGLLASRVLVVLRPTKEDEIAALELFEKLADQEVSFTDCVSFALMQQAGIARAFSFDRHFDILGFQRVPA
jgi:predicted nucleic acid-binding protein